jgi:predicted RNA-binding protein Jag
MPKLPAAALRGFETLALNVALQVKARKTSIRLEPMSAFERRIIPSYAANDAEVFTESTVRGSPVKWW